MISERDEQLIQDVLEGDAPASRRAELERLLASSREARERHAQMSELFNVLADAAAEPLPSGLHADIVRTLAAEPPRVETRARRWSLRPLVGAFLTGAAAASLVVIAVMREPGGVPDPAAVSGTLMPLGTAAGSVVSRAAIEAGSGPVQLVTRRLGDEVRLEVGVRTASPVEIQCEFASEALAVTGVRWSRPPAGSVTASEGRIALAGVAAGDFVVTFHARGPGDAAIRVHAGLTGRALLHTASQQPGG